MDDKSREGSAVGVAAKSSVDAEGLVRDVPAEELDERVVVEAGGCVAEVGEEPPLGRKVGGADEEQNCRRREQTAVACIHEEGGGYKRERDVRTRVSDRGVGGGHRQHGQDG
eukprot:SAG11_NODE_2163_length_3728_cov_19.144944_2_plen_112_part_00